MVEKLKDVKVAVATGVAGIGAVGIMSAIISHNAKKRVKEISEKAYKEVRDDEIIKALNKVNKNLEDIKEGKTTKK